jgi:hypothetical protein
MRVFIPVSFGMNLANLAYTLLAGVPASFVMNALCLVVTFLGAWEFMTGRYLRYDFVERVMRGGPPR